MINKNTSFITLQDLAKKSVDAASIELKKVDDKYRAGLGQLTTLNRYYQEYQDRLNNILITGINGRDLLNFQSFIATVERSIIQQKQMLVTLSIKQKQAAQNLYQCQKKLNAYTKLIEKQQKVFALQENRLQQKMTDEFAQQQSMRRAIYE